MLTAKKRFQPFHYFTCVLLAFLLSLSGCREKVWDEYYAREASMSKITDVLRTLPDYSVFVEALKLAEIDDYLNHVGIFTVYAPNNVAFETFLKQRGLSSVNELDTASLKKILRYHVHGGRLEQYDYQQAFNYNEQTRFKTVGGPNLIVEASPNGPVFKVNDITVNKPDLRAHNGIIHGLDKVLTILPNADSTIRRTPEFSFFGKAVKRFDIWVFNAAISPVSDLGVIDSVFSQSTSLPVNLRNEGATATIFAPTDAAFQTYLTQNGYASIEAIPESVLMPLISHHLVNVFITPSGLGKSVRMSSTKNLTVQKTQVTSTRNFVSNGIIYGVNTVFKP